MKRFKLLRWVLIFTALVLLPIVAAFAEPLGSR